MLGQDPARAGIGKIVLTAASVVLGLALMLIVGLFAFPGLHVTAIGWLTLVWVAALGLLATIPLGTSGIADRRPPVHRPDRAAFAGLAAISGIFYPITHLPGWLEAIGQVFPMYWLGLGMRAGLLPDALRSVELDGSWRLGYVLLALCGWAAVGLLAAPPVLRRIAPAGSRCPRSSPRARTPRCCEEPDVRDGTDVGDSALRSWSPSTTGSRCSGPSAAFLPPGARGRARGALPDGGLPGARPKCQPQPLPGAPHRRVLRSRSRSCSRPLPLPAARRGGQDRLQQVPLAGCRSSHSQ